MPRRKSRREKISAGLRLGLPRRQAVLLAGLNTPEDIQAFINRVPVNFEKGGDTCHSAAHALKMRHAHCIEGAFIAACALFMMGRPPLLMDMRAKGDMDHVVTLFKRGKYWGAISKSNHVWLRWRDPVYRGLRELAMSYFHEYVSGKNKTLVAYSAPFDLRRLPPQAWASGDAPCFDTALKLDRSRHVRLISNRQAAALRPRDAIERKADRLREWPEKKPAPCKKGQVLTTVHSS